MQSPVAYDRQGDIALVRIDSPPVNALSLAVRQGLSACLNRAMQERETGLRALVLLGAGRGFIAGADIAEFGAPPQPPHLPDLCDEIEALPLLVVAAMHCMALGGGLEVALAADYRIGHPDLKLGLPEVHLGLIPGAGGTQRLPRLVGAEQAVHMIATGRPAGAEAALKLGLLDRIAEGAPDAFGLSFAQELVAQDAALRPAGALPPPDPIDWAATRESLRQKARGQISPLAGVDAVEAAATLPIADGLKKEGEIFAELIETDQCKALIHAFFGERAVGQLPALKDVSPRPCTSLGIVGGGTMGAGIATAALLAGLSVTLLEASTDKAETARDRIESNLRAALSRGKLTQGRFDEILQGALTLSTQYDAFAEVDLVIEAAFEDMEVKRAIFAELDRSCKPGCILATNTSYLDVNEIAAATSRPADVLGLHFFSPAHIMKLLEVVVADATALDVTATGFALGRKLGKICVRAGVCDGFIGNRILAHYRDALGHLVLDGASPFDIDTALTDFGLAMGPHAAADLAGLDIGWATRKRKAPHRHPQERIPTYIDRLCEQGHFGQKTGKGYYIYPAGQRRGTPNPDIMQLIEAERAERQITPRDFTGQEIVQRYMCAMVNEAAKVVGDGTARRPLDVDMTLLFGYGFPRYRGGPMKWADLQGLPRVLEEIERFAKEDAWFWEPAPLLTQLVAEGRTFEDLNKAAA